MPFCVVTNAVKEQVWVYLFCNPVICGMVMERSRLEIALSGMVAVLCIWAFEDRLGLVLVICWLCRTCADMHISELSVHHCRCRYAFEGMMSSFFYYQTTKPGTKLCKVSLRSFAL